MTREEGAGFLATDRQEHPRAARKQVHRLGDGRGRQPGIARSRPPWRPFQAGIGDAGHGGSLTRVARDLRGERVAGIGDEANVFVAKKVG